MAPQLTIHKERIAVVSPRTTQIDLVHTFCSNQATIVEDISIRLILGC